MALWGISTTQETWANSYAIPKFLNDQDRNFTPHNCFADDRGWIYRTYGTTVHSGLGTIYTDAVLVPVAGLNTVASASTVFGPSGITPVSEQCYTGIAPATPVAVFFEDPNNATPITVAAGGTTGVEPAATVKVNVVYNELVFVSTGATINIQTFDINNENASSHIVGYAETAVGSITVFNNTNGTAGGENEVYNLTGVDGTDFAGQITNRVSFAFTAPAATALLTANDIFTDTTANHVSATKVADGGTGIGTTTFFVSNSDLTGVVAGVSSVTIDTNQGIGKTNAPIASVGSTSFVIGRPGITTAGFSTIRDQLTVGVGATIQFSNLTAQTKLKVHMDRGIVGTVTSFYPDDTAATKTFINAGVATSPGAALPIGIDRQVGGAGTFMSGSFEENYAGTVDGSAIVGLGTTSVQVSPASTTF